MSKKAVLVFDMLEDFLAEEGTLYIGPAAKNVRLKVEERVKEARREGHPIFFICDSHLPQDKEFEMFPPHCIQGEKGAQVVSEISPLSHERLIFKRRYSGFFGTDLDLSLRELGVRRLELAGVCTQICVLYTAADARSLGYEVELYRDAVASFDEEAHRFALNEMEKTLGVEIK